MLGLPQPARIATFWDCGRRLLNSMEPVIPRHIRLTSHPGSAGEGMVKLRWGAASPEERGPVVASPAEPRHRNAIGSYRSEEHTSELQSQSNLVCRLLLVKKKQGG